MMNLELLESFCQNYPEESDGTLDCISQAISASFNKLGTLLAVGCNDGRLVIWDFLTRGIAKVITCHSHPICSISWSRNGHKILTSSTDNTCTIFDVVSSEIDHRYRFPSPILKIQFHPRNSSYFLVCPLRHAALLLHLNGTHVPIPLSGDDDVNIVASFDRRGEFIYTGNSKGIINAYQVSLPSTGASGPPEITLKASFRIGQAATTAVKQIEFGRRGNCFLLNSADRIIRVYNCDEVLGAGILKEGEDDGREGPEPVQKLQDLVNKTMWKKCVFSGDGEYICAGSARQHALYIWEKGVGNLVKILQGTKGELLLDVVWHPMRPIVASISSGVVSVWAQNQVENWSAFAPDFKELDENVEYEERESEFDEEDEDKGKEGREGGGGDGDWDGEGERVDVVGVDRIEAWCSSDEEGEGEGEAFLMFLPTAPEIVEDYEEAVVMMEKGGGVGAGGGGDEEEGREKRKRVKTCEISLPNAPKDEVHPFLSNNKPNKDKPGGGGNGGGGGGNGGFRKSGGGGGGGHSSSVSGGGGGSSSSSSSHYHNRHKSGGGGGSSGFDQKKRDRIK